MCSRWCNVGRVICDRVSRDEPLIAPGRNFRAPDPLHSSSLYTLAVVLFNAGGKSLHTAPPPRRIS